MVLNTQEEREFWKACFVACLNSDSDAAISFSERRADQAVDYLRKRLPTNKSIDGTEKVYNEKVYNNLADIK